MECVGVAFHLRRTNAPSPRAATEIPSTVVGSGTGTGVKFTKISPPALPVTEKVSALKPMVENADWLLMSRVLWFPAPVAIL